MNVVYVRSDNGRKIIIFQPHNESLRCRQRCRMSNGEKVNPLRFASYKETLKSQKKNGTKVLGLYKFNTISRL